VSIPIINLTALLCYSDPFSSEFAFLVSEEQRQLLIDCINNEIISKTPPSAAKYNNHFPTIEYGNKAVGKPQPSQIEVFFQQLQTTMGVLQERNLNAGKFFELNL
jgi:hypothetical protein